MPIPLRFFPFHQTVRSGFDTVIVANVRYLVAMVSGDKRNENKKERNDSIENETSPDLRMPTCRGVDIEELSIPQLQRCLAERKFSSRELTACYLERIERVNGVLKCV